MVEVKQREHGNADLHNELVWEQREEQAESAPSAPQEQEMGTPHRGLRTSTGVHIKLQEGEAKGRGTKREQQHRQSDKHAVRARPDRAASDVTAILASYTYTDASVGAVWWTGRGVALAAASTRSTQLSHIGCTLGSARGFRSNT